MNGLFELVKHYQMSVNVSAIVFHRVLVQVLQYHIPNLPVVSLQVSIPPTLPESTEGSVTDHLEPIRETSLSIK